MDSDSGKRMTFAQKTLIALEMLSVLRAALLPTVFAIFRQPSLLLHGRQLQQRIMASIWTGGMGDGVNENNKQVRARLITPNATGIVLDEKTKISKYIAIEPNLDMHPFIIAAAEKSGIPFEILAIGINELDPYLRVDTVVCVLTLCSVGNVEKAAHTIYNALKPGGVLVAFEHVKSKLKEVEWWQRFWEPIWGLLFDSCKLTVDSLDVLQRLEWIKAEVSIMEGDIQTNLFVHEHGVFQKPKK
ncbi:hypothetical protein HK100_000025 [Physocladia obscura]|uniref:Methyltransferase type 11 domain-containing protein n=1 Tax=Physocladia obscura TaxID=109957 RepID=A0AAD5TAX9_9FUNG|nr:hypothetical protein HK100_000025 [Physocladia obscura]